MNSQSEELALRIQRFILERKMQPGMRLPSERELAEHLSASRGSIREALRELEAVGVVEKQPRSGTYIRNTHAAVLAPVAQDWQQIDPENIEQIFEMRMLVEPGCASLATTRATDEDLETLRSMIGVMQQAIETEDVAVFQQADTQFHQVITRATRNQHLISLIEGVMNALRQSIRVSLHVPGQMERALTGHQQILVAIENGQSEWAAAAMETHLRDAWHYISAQIADLPADGEESLPHER